eukprot:3272062-Amphidinium_carterae.1
MFKSSLRSLPDSVEVLLLLQDSGTTFIAYSLKTKSVQISRFSHTALRSARMISSSAILISMRMNPISGNVNISHAAGLMHAMMPNALEEATVSMSNCPGKPAKLLSMVVGAKVLKVFGGMIAVFVFGGERARSHSTTASPTIARLPFTVGLQPEQL